MNAIRRILSIVWFAAALYAGYYLIIEQAIPKFQTGKTDDLIPAGIYTFILVPLIVGSLGVFGLYSLQGEYDQED
jgi:hypothetical protein